MFSVDKVQLGVLASAAYHDKANNKCVGIPFLAIHRELSRNSLEPFSSRRKLILFIRIKRLTVSRICLFACSPQHLKYLNKKLAPSGSHGSKKKKAKTNNLSEWRTKKDEEEVPRQTFVAFRIFPSLLLSLTIKKD